MDRYIVLTAVFLGWFCSGIHMTTMNLASGSAIEDFAKKGDVDSFRWERLWGPIEATSTVSTLKTIKATWFARFNASFLFGAALGGLVFGMMGDRIGRARALGISILAYSIWGFLGSFCSTPEQLLLNRFLVSMGVGGMWPNGVALASEFWSDVSRPFLSGLIGTAANIGIVLLSTICYFEKVTPESWRWVLMLGGFPTILGLWSLMIVPESPAWMAHQKPGQKGGISTWSVFKPPLLSKTLIGISIGAIPLLGGWGVTAWTIPWTEDVNEKAGIAPDPYAKALTAIMRASGGAIGSLLGGWIASVLGRRTAYGLISLLSLITAEIVFTFMNPLMPGFSASVFVLGFITTIYFGWLPLYLPELFPTYARSTGAGISFNMGRILTGLGVLGTGSLTAFFGDYARAGQATSLVYALGIVVILFAPDTTKLTLTQTATAK